MAMMMMNMMSMMNMMGMSTIPKTIQQLTNSISGANNGAITFNGYIGSIPCEEGERTPLYAATNNIQNTNNSVNINVVAKNYTGALAAVNSAKSAANGLNTAINNFGCGDNTTKTYMHGLVNNWIVKYDQMVILVNALISMGMVNDYVPTPVKIVKEMLKLGEVNKSDKLLDLGCGDGRILIAAAKLGAKAIGVDNDPERIKETKTNALNSGLSATIDILSKDFDKDEINFDGVTVVTTYLLTETLDKLKEKYFDKLPSGTRIVSHEFTFSNWQYIEKKEITSYSGQVHEIYLYKV